jgi:hypothetical protein
MMLIFDAQTESMQKTLECIGSGLAGGLSLVNFLPYEQMISQLRLRRQNEDILQLHASRRDLVDGMLAKGRGRLADAVPAETAQPTAAPAPPQNLTLSLKLDTTKPELCKVCSG